MSSFIRGTIFLAEIPFDKLVSLGVIGQGHLVAEFDAFRTSDSRFQAGSVCVALDALDLAVSYLPTRPDGDLTGEYDVPEHHLADVYFNEGGLYARLEPMMEIMGTSLLSGAPFAYADVPSAPAAPVHALKRQWRAVVIEWAKEDEDRNPLRGSRASASIKSLAANILFEDRVDEIRLTNRELVKQNVLAQARSPSLSGVVARLWPDVDLAKPLSVPAWQALKRLQPALSSKDFSAGLAEKARAPHPEVEPPENLSEEDEAPANIEPDVLQVLRQCSATEVGVFLPQTQLDRKLYSKVNDVLTALGGKWTTGKKCHVFKDDPREVLEVVQVTGSYTNPKDFGFFWTSEELAAKVASMCRLEPGMSVLEPNGGHGALADAAAAFVGVENVETCEVLPRNASVLRGKGYRVSEGDFLLMEPSPRFDRVIMNPPFGKQADMKHVEHAARFLKPDGLLVSIMSPAYSTRSTKQATQFRELMAAAGDDVESVPAGAFKASGTNVATVIVTLDASRFPWNMTVQSDACDDACMERARP